MLSLLQSVEAISACRDRGRLPVAFSQSVVALLGDSAGVGVFIRGAQGDVVLRKVSAATIRDSDAQEWGDFIEEVRLDRSVKTRTIAGRNCGAVTLHASELTTDQMILAYDVGQDDAAQHAEEIACLARIHDSQIRLLDYSELDTLTRLLNRKTFDETFDRLLTSHSGAATEGGFDDRRGNLEDGSPAWLCVVDIDHFKRVNDSFGHLFGDEVLLRMGELMRKTFRGGDRLFRFGGEEFVVILNAANEKLAALSFNRFRTSVENHEFPQVGKVTCSIGFTAVSDMDVPTDVVGRADEALYFAKEHGRNQVCCYEQLVAEGAIEKPVPAEAPVADDFDIDALFG
ncbi:MAG: GGDEF domain-containing protein [Propionivibrio sp.]|nr:GGDEF domain-containing protein [Propionivibrio sp.]